MRRANMTLTDEARAVLEQQPDGRRSAYVSALLVSTQRRWSTALLHLRHAGWRDVELAAACEILRGVVVPNEIVALGRRRLEAVELGCASGRWRYIVDRLRKRPDLVAALRDVADEYARDGAELLRALQSEG